MIASETLGMDSLTAVQHQKIFLSPVANDFLTLYNAVLLTIGIVLGIIILRRVSAKLTLAHTILELAKSHGAVSIAQTEMAKGVAEDAKKEAKVVREQVEKTLEKIDKKIDDSHHAMKAVVIESPHPPHINISNGTDTHEPQSPSPGVD